MLRHEMERRRDMMELSEGCISVKNGWEYVYSDKASTTVVCRRLQLKGGTAALKK